ncbi:hypothetical protein [Streptomyces alkaliterrae]|uniref:Uncharacterized protein n=1 Tax=Streptomyces alkaliterrae TaxID=2213162 RepID=A0A5P0YUL3_9ACTN|nr:hypothetical protein [Streptomyces alkaliterrae]MBB1261083.1 hypothetical protein [Streptomyces alkaliterrae]MQS03590.1 hypothetical protein [Streptomyces alkaliterrae]
MLVALTVGGTTASAFALGEYHDWNKKSSPLVAKGYGSQGSAYGKWRIYNGANGTTSKVYSYSKLSNADDHKVYVNLETMVNAGYCVQPKYTNCTQKYWVHDGTETKHHSSSSYKYYKAHTGVAGQADYARGRVRARIDVPWRTDPATGWSYTSGSEY